ncbi:MAG: hypothetical protein ACK5FS_06955 [Planctomycetota bacterium]
MSAVNPVNAVQYTPPSGGVATHSLLGCLAPVSLLASSVVNPFAIIDTLKYDTAK